MEVYRYDFSGVARYLNTEVDFESLVEQVEDCGFAAGQLADCDNAREIADIVGCLDSFRKILKSIKKVKP